MSLDIRLKKVDRTYHLGESIKGVVVVTSQGSLSHNGITLQMEGVVHLQLSSKSVGVFEAFVNSVKPIQVCNATMEICKAGKLPNGKTEFPFEFPIKAVAGQTLFETYHGVFVNVQYLLRCDMPRPMLAKNLSRNIEFVIEIPSAESVVHQKMPFTITHESIDNLKVSSSKMPPFKITGHLNSGVWDIREPLTGELTVVDTDAQIRSIELQLVRVETCGCADGFAKEATEIQNIQVGDGDVARGLSIPLYMIFPRLFTCPTLATRTFKIEFEMNIVVLLHDGLLISENFSLLLRRPLAEVTSE